MTLKQGICSEINYVNSLSDERRVIIQQQLRICDDCGKEQNHVADTPYTTLVHGDLWTNNIMIKKGHLNLAKKTKKVCAYLFVLICFLSFLYV